MPLLSKLKTSRKTLFATLFIFYITLFSCGNAITEMREHLLDGRYYTVTLTQPANGRITADPEIPSNGKVVAGREITFTATPDANYMVKSWSGAVYMTGDMEKATLTVSEDVEVSAIISTNTIPEGFLFIVPPASEFTTEKEIAVQSGDNPVYGSQTYWKGVFYPGRKVKLSPYWIGKTQVTYNQWREVYNWAIKPENGYVFANAGKAGKDGQTGAVGNPLPEDSTYGNHPVTKVNWRDCIIWCNAYTEKIKGEEHCVYRVGSGNGGVLRDATKNDGAVPPDYEVDSAFAAMDKKGFRLPTEAEWEFAARYEKGETNNNDGTAVSYSDNLWLTKLTYASGATGDYNDATATGLVAWFGTTPNSTPGNSGGHTHEVGTRVANKLGLSDMSGNVREWCFDWYNGDATIDDSAYESGGVVLNPLGATSGGNIPQRVSRGGTCTSNSMGCSVGYRSPDKPDNKFYYLGFRLARSL